jgi:hypothetical protein
MIDYQQLYRDLHDYVIAATGLPDESVVPTYDNASSEPSQNRGQICSINIINQVMIGNDARSYTDKSGGQDLDEKTSGDRNVTASIKTYGDSAQNTIEQIILYLSTSAGIFFLNDKDIGYLRHGNTLDISSIQNGEFENRRQVDIEFHVVFDITADVNEISTASIDYVFEASQTITGNIEVTP